MRLYHLRTKSQGRYGSLLRVGRDSGILIGGGCGRWARRVVASGLGRLRPTRKGKKTMRSWLTGAALVGALALPGAASAHADHAYVFGGVPIYRGSGPAVAEYSSQYTTCSGPSCAVTVAVGKRDYGRFVKWCGAVSREVTVSPGSFGGTCSARDRRPGI